MNCRETYRFMLMRYPSLYRCPLDVSCQLFCSAGGGFRWHTDGAIRSIDTGAGGPPIPLTDHSLELPPELGQLKAMRSLEYQAKLLERKFIVENMEQVLDSGPTACFFNTGVRKGPYVFEGICLEYAAALNFPANIQKEWAACILEFLGWWILNLRMGYGLGSIRATELDFWPENGKLAHQAMLDAKKRLWPLVTGRTIEESERVADEIIDKILAERACPAA